MADNTATINTAALNLASVPAAQAADAYAVGVSANPAIDTAISSPILPNSNNNSGPTNPVTTESKITTSPPTPSTPEINPLDQPNIEKQPANLDLIKNIVSAETSGPEANILEEAPEVDMSLIQDFAPQKSLLLLTLKIALGTLITIILGAALFFSFQLSDLFNPITSRLNIPNLTANLTAGQNKLIDFQTELNSYNYLQAKQNLDEFSYHGDAFLMFYEVLNGQTTDEKDKTNAKAELARLRGDLLKTFTAARDHLSQPINAIVVDIDAKTDAEWQALFKEKLIAFLQQKGAENKIEQKRYLQTSRLIGNDNLKQLLISTDIADLSDKETYDLIKKMNKLVTNDLSIMQQIKEKRIKWSDLMSEIERRTIAVDAYYTQDQYDQFGGIRYTSYDFNTENRSIQILGETKRFDTTNFTTITNLIDEVNRSKFFKGADMRSFSKSGSVSEGYTAQLKLDLILQTPDEVDPNDGQSLDEIPDLLKDQND